MADEKTWAITITLTDSDWDLLVDILYRGCDIIGDFTISDQVTDQLERVRASQTELEALRARN